MSFDLTRYTRSATAEARKIDNTPTPEIIECLQRVDNDLATVSHLWGEPIIVTSGYRCPKLNEAVGGSLKPLSAHTFGRAADMKPHAILLQTTDADQKRVLRDYFERLRKSDMPYDEIIIEGTKSGSEWIHYQIAPLGKTPRRLALQASGDLLGGKMNYTRVSEG